MRKAIGIGGFGAIALVAMFIVSSVPMVGGACDCVCEYGKTVDLIAGQHTDAGDIVVSHDLTGLHITITTSDSWYISEYHVAAAMSLAGIPQNKNNPQPGHFPYSDDVWTQEVVVDIPFDEISDFDCGKIYLAVHTVVKQIGANGKCSREETAWGNGEAPWKNWAMYFTYCPTKLLDLPTGTEINVNFDLKRSDRRYWDVCFPDYTDTNSVYHYLNQYGNDWCIETGQYLSTNDHATPYDMQLISTIGLTGYQTYRVYNSKDPVTIPDCAWNEINWLVNNDAGYGYKDIQYAIWALIGLLNTDGTTGLYATVDGTLYWTAASVGQNAIDLYNAAITHCTFYPCCGQKEVVIIHSATCQDTIVEVDP
jgi:hypothetical protein